MAVAPDDPSFLARLKGFLGSPSTRDFGLALLANSGYSSTPRTFGEVAGQSALAAQQMGQQRQMDDIRSRYMQAQIQAMQAKPLQSTPSSVLEYQYAKQNGFTGSFEEWQTKSRAQSDPAEVSAYKYFSALTPEQKQEFLKLKRNVGSDYQVVDVGGVPTVVYKPAAGARPGQGGGTPLATPLSSLPAEVQGQGAIAGAKAGAQKSAESQAQAAFDLPRVKQNVEQSIDTIDKLAAHPGLQYITGISSKVPVVPGTSQAAADALAKQVEGQTFLQAFNTLKGAGAITEQEGTKATSAIARLQRSQGTEDYKAALKDLRKVLSDGLERMNKQAGNTSAPAVRRTVNGKTYIQQNGQWYEDDGT